MTGTLATQSDRGGVGRVAAQTPTPPRATTRGRASRVRAGAAPSAGHPTSRGGGRTGPGRSEGRDRRGPQRMDTPQLGGVHPASCLQTRARRGDRPWRPWEEWVARCSEGRGLGRGPPRGTRGHACHGHPRYQRPTSRLFLAPRTWPNRRKRHPLPRAGRSYSHAWAQGRTAGRGPGWAAEAVQGCPREEAGATGPQGPLLFGDPGAAETESEVTGVPGLESHLCHQVAAGHDGLSFGVPSMQWNGGRAGVPAHRAEGQQRGAGLHCGTQVQGELVPAQGCLAGAERRVPPPQSHQVPTLTSKPQDGHGDAAEWERDGHVHRPEGSKERLHASAPSEEGRGCGTVFCI